jgi:hypothetical protein
MRRGWEAHEATARPTRQQQIEAEQRHSRGVQPPHAQLPASRVAFLGARPAHRRDHPRAVQRLAEAVRDLCRTFGVSYLQLLQPALHDPDGKAATARELALARGLDVWKTAVQTGYPLLRAAGHRLADQGVQFVDASDLFKNVEGDMFVDYCHFEERGNEILADRLSQAILTRLP